MSRYYDPVTHRFINGDTFLTTGLGLLGYNMFAYALNNSILLADSSGNRPCESTTVSGENSSNRRISCNYQAKALSETRRVSKYGAASNYYNIPSSNGNRESNPNCYSYAIGEYSKSYNPGDFSGTKYEPNVYSVGSAVEADFKSLQRGIRPIESYDSPIFSNEYRIALRVSDVYAIQVNENEIAVSWDYHFMVQTSSGKWAEKHGPGGETILHNTGNPSTISWDLGNSIVGYYNSKILYYAITN